MQIPNVLGTSKSRTLARTLLGPKPPGPVIGEDNEEETEKDKKQKKRTTEVKTKFIKENIRAYIELIVKQEK